MQKEIFYLRVPPHVAAAPQQPGLDHPKAESQVLHSHLPRGWHRTKCLGRLLPSQAHQQGEQEQKQSSKDSELPL